MGSWSCGFGLALYSNSSESHWRVLSGKAKWSHLFFKKFTLVVHSGYSLGLCSPSLRFLICKTAVWDKIFHPAYPRKRSPFQAKHSSSLNHPLHSLVSSPAWLFLVDFTCVTSSGIGVLPTQLNTLPVVCPTWGGGRLPAPLWDQFWHMLTVMVSLHHLFAATPGDELCEIIPCYSEAASPTLPPSRILSIVDNTRAEKTHRTVPLRWSWGKSWPNWDSRHHLCKSGMLF